MALTEKQRSDKDVRLNLSPMIDVVFLILIYFIVSIQLEESLDDILKLPEAHHSQEQPESRFQVYVLKARVNDDGTVNPDSAGLVALFDRGNPDSIFIRLDDLPDMLEERREEVLKQIVAMQNIKRQQKGYAPLTQQERDREKDKLTLMIKADDLTFYGRIIQVVNKAKEIKVTRFAMVTTTESSKQVKAKKKELGLTGDKGAE